jgi:hypothetical protein
MGLIVVELLNIRVSEQFSGVAAQSAQALKISEELELFRPLDPTIQAETRRRGHRVTVCGT